MACMFCICLRMVDTFIIMLCHIYRAAEHFGRLFALPLALCNEKTILYEPNGNLV